MGRWVDEDEWRQSLEHAKKGRWVAQRFFEAEADASGRITNYGVFVIAGDPAGLYARMQAGATDAYAESVPVLIDPS